MSKERYQELEDKGLGHFDDDGEWVRDFIITEKGITPPVRELPKGFELKPDADVTMLYYHAYLVARYNTASFSMDFVKKDIKEYLEKKGEENDTT